MKKFLPLLFISLFVLNACSTREIYNTGNTDLSYLIADGRCPDGFEAIYGNLTKLAINCKAIMPSTPTVSSETEVKAVTEA